MAPLWRFMEVRVKESETRSRGQCHLLYHNRAKVTGVHHDLRCMLGSVYSQHSRRACLADFDHPKGILWRRIVGDLVRYRPELESSDARPRNSLCFGASAREVAWSCLSTYQPRISKLEVRRSSPPFNLSNPNSGDS